MSDERPDRNSKVGWDRHTLNSWGCLHNGICETCALIRRCEDLKASYEAKVEDLARETLRTSALTAQLDRYKKELADVRQRLVRANRYADNNISGGSPW